MAEHFCKIRHPLAVSASERELRRVARKRILASSGGQWTDETLAAFTQFLRARAAACDRRAQGMKEDTAGQCTADI